eukprot:TRINITY_DN10830_c0_g3_i2.p2 TRINITY_DN10830_c0_g3~~TRINITY_DN10830_c0_g3_i2.p2  ORF type:complete len:123 (+),score=29.47 TRINITY_DN10830_c0_g3_i2:134-502(+)
MIRRPPRSTQGVSSAASDVYKRQEIMFKLTTVTGWLAIVRFLVHGDGQGRAGLDQHVALRKRKFYAVFMEQIPDTDQYIALDIGYPLSLIHISEPTRPLYISYAVFCLKKKKQNKNKNQPHL